MHTCPYEVGDVLTTSNATHPSARWPGTSWQAVESFILGASAAHPAGSTGGEETHVLITDELPNHSHVQQLPYSGVLRPWAMEDQSEGGMKVILGGVGGGATSGEVATGGTGKGWAHNNMPPYKSYYIWERTA